MSKALLHPLRIYRKRNNLRLEDLAPRVGISSASLSRIEMRIIRPSIETARAIEEVTGVKRWHLRPDVWEVPKRR